ncbi:lasso peptide biosynthesis PqqD family chaperone [Crossiella sp. NPDC003009]
MPSLRQDVSTVEVEDGMVLLDERTGRYYQLNNSGALVLTVLMEGGGEQDAAEALTQCYEVPPERARQDAGAVLAQLCATGLVLR